MKTTKIDVSQINLSEGSNISTQYSIMPNPSQDLLDMIVQYIGQTNENFINGYFYKVVYEDNIYKWTNISVSSGSTNIGSQTAVDLLIMQNQWKSRMIEALNGKVPGYTDEDDSINTIIDKFSALTGNTPDSVFKVFKANGNGRVRPKVSLMPTVNNNSWEITICKKCYASDILVNKSVYEATGIALRIDYRQSNSTVILSVPVYKEGSSTELELMEINPSPDPYNPINVYPIYPGYKYWFKVGYNNTYYYIKISEDGANYHTIYEYVSDRKTQCGGIPNPLPEYYLDIWVSSTFEEDILFLEDTKVVIDDNIVFDGSSNIDVYKDVEWRDGAVYLPDIIKLY